MARPKKQTVDYFPHDTDAGEKRTLSIIQNKFGNDGYAFWFKLLQLLGKSPGHYYSFKALIDWEFLLAKTHIPSTETAKEILETLAGLEAIDAELYKHKIIWSQNFTDRLTDVYDRRQAPPPLKPDWRVIENNNGVSANDNPISSDSNPQTKLKETKLKEIKTNNSNDRDELYKILEGTKGFPLYSQENLWKLEDVIKDYPEVNYLLEFKKFREYWNTRKLKRPWLALRNWLGKAKEKGGQTKQDKGRGFPKTYTPTADYDDL